MKKAAKPCKSGPSIQISGLNDQIKTGKSPSVDNRVYSAQITKRESSVFDRILPSRPSRISRRTTLPYNNNYYHPTYSRVNSTVSSDVQHVQHNVRASKFRRQSTSEERAEPNPTASSYHSYPTYNRVNSTVALPIMNMQSKPVRVPPPPPQTFRTLLALSSQLFTVVLTNRVTEALP